MGWQWFGVGELSAAYDYNGLKLTKAMTEALYVDGYRKSGKPVERQKEPREKRDANTKRRSHLPPPHLGMYYPVIMHESVSRFGSIFYAWLAWQCLLLSQPAASSWYDASSSSTYPTVFTAP